MIVPTLELPPVSPFTSQVTAGFASFTVALNRAVPPTTTFADFGEMVTVPGALGPLMETEAFAVLLSSALLTAVTVTFEGIGTYGGAVYVPVLSMVPKALSPPGIPLTIQLTLVMLLLVTVAVKTCCALVVIAVD